VCSSDLRALLATAAAFRADAPAVLTMRLRIAELREGRTRRALASGHAAVRALRLEEADRWLGVAEASAAQPAGVEALRERIFLARHYGPFAPGQVFADLLAPGVRGPEMVVVRFGRFRMGEDDDQRPREGPEREVVFERGFALARNEVTVADFRRFVVATGYRTRATREGSSVVFDERGGSLTEHEGVDWQRDFLGRIASDDRPVTHVAVEDAQAYVAWLSKRTGHAYRLPSEAEWEYALRAGQHTQYPWGDDAPPRAVGNLSGEGDKSSAGRSWGTPIRGYTDFFWGTAPVRSFPVERWGTYDLVGNVSEWTQDCWHEGFRRAPTDGSAWVNPGCPQRVVRGASWASALDQSRSASRMAVDATSTNPWLGFRVARDIRPPNRQGASPCVSTRSAARRSSNPRACAAAAASAGGYWCCSPGMRRIRG
jgi:formylglycine-generating enzyme required for sulfatase activity